MMERLRALRHEMGWSGMAALGLVGLALLFLHSTVAPLEQRGKELKAELARSEAIAAAPEGAGWAAAPEGAARAATPEAKLHAFYDFFKSPEQATDWLAKLDAIARDVGISLPAADYRMHKTGTRIERYEIALPMTGSYSQIRAFIENALAQIPIVSLDHVTFRRERASDPVVQADVRLTLHLVKP